MLQVSSSIFGDYSIVLRKYNLSLGNISSFQSSSSVVSCESVGTAVDPVAHHDDSKHDILLQQFHRLELLIQVSSFSSRLLITYYMRNLILMVVLHCFVRADLIDLRRLFLLKRRSLLRSNKDCLGLKKKESSYFSCIFY